ARTKLGTEELAGKLQARGFSAAAINGDIVQQQRERTIQQLKDGKIDILVATDVAARGLDVERISHVINYDVPHDPESYTHRIGRTGRAGRSGEAILFIAPRERNLLKAIERATRQPISMLELPSIQAVNDVRIAKFKDQISDALAAGGLETFQSLIEDFERERNIPAIEIAAALAKLARGDVPLLLDKNKREPQGERSWSDAKPAHTGKFERTERSERPERFERHERKEQTERPAFPRKERIERQPDAGMQSFRIEVGHAHGVKPGNIVGAIANEAGLDSKYIGRIEIYDDYSTLDLPDTMPDELLDHLKTVWVAGQQLHISRGAEPAKASVKPAFKKAEAFDKPAGRDAEMHTEKAASPKKERTDRKGDAGMQAFRIEVGHVHGVKPGNIVGAIANEAGLEAKHIGRIEIFDDYSLLDLPDGMPDEVFEQLKTVSVAGQQLRISHSGDRAPTEHKSAGKKITLSAPRKGGDRRVNEKKFGDKAPFKKPSDSGNRTADATKPKPKPHRKGVKPA
ncbi:MAG: ATP-dependent helicase DeaD, partial [Burkholderiales bacterium]